MSLNSGKKCGSFHRLKNRSRGREWPNPETQLQESLLYGTEITATHTVQCGRCARVIKQGERIARHMMTLKFHCTSCRENEKRIVNQHRRLQMM